MRGKLKYKEKRYWEKLSNHSIGYNRSKAISFNDYSYTCKIRRIRLSLKDSTAKKEKKNKNNASIFLELEPFHKKMMNEFSLFLERKQKRNLNSNKKLSNFALIAMD